MVRYLEPVPPPARLKCPVVQGKVLVFSPHPDDETIGPGGTLVQHARRGDPVHVIFMTAGTSGDPTGREDPVAYAARRAAEAQAAAEVLGVGELEFWGYPDNHKVNENDLAAILPRVAEALDRVDPDVVYAPHALEQHQDHQTVSVLVSRALAARRRPPLAFGYEVWSASSAAYVLDISAEYEQKMAALRCYSSQLEHTDIVRFITGLNAYRAVFLDKGARFGEAFVPLPKAAAAGFP